MEDLKAFLFEGEHVERTSPSRPAPPPAATAGRWSEASGAFASSSPSPLRAVDSGRVAIFDATNSTRSRRAWLREQLAGLPLKLLYIESVCTDEKIVEGARGSSRRDSVSRSSQHHFHHVFLSHSHSF